MKKNLSLLATAVLALTFVSCSSDDDDVAPKQAAFIGNWKSYSERMVVIENGNPISEVTVYYDEKNYSVLSFSNDKSFNHVEVEDGDAETWIGNWFMSGEVLYMNYKDAAYGYDWTDDYAISTCTSSMFVIVEKEIETVGSITRETIIETTLKKQN